MKRNRSKKIILLFSFSVFFSLVFGTYYMRSARAEPDVTITITVLFSDGYPVEGAWVKITNNTNNWIWPRTNSSGQSTKSDNVPPGWYWAKAYYPESDTYFGGQIFNVDSDVEYVTINGNYEITPPVIEILSPQNITYTTSSVPLNYTVDDYSPISWTGYSLDGQANVTSGNTTLTGLTSGSHNIIVYANDTYGNMGSSGKVYFTRTGYITVTVQYADAYPRSGADVWIYEKVPSIPMNYLVGRTGADGKTIRYSHTLSDGDYWIYAKYPAPGGPQFGPNTLLKIINGNGSQTVRDSDHKSIEIYSPENKTYLTSSVFLDFTFHNSSAISWIGYSLDRQPNVTITGDTNIVNLSNGLHSVIVYGNDTNGYLGYSDTVYFTVQANPVGGIYIPVNKLELLAPYIGLTIMLVVAVATVIYVKKRKRNNI